jgi:5-oxoprolinase (ATP-hydrolysing)
VLTNLRRTVINTGVEIKETQVGADIGGTFTDVLRRGADGSIQVEKRLSTPGDYSRAIIEALEAMAEADDFSDLSVLAHATTIATNAVLEETGARVGLITTKGFRDVLEFGRLQRSALYDLMWEKQPPLVPRRHRHEVEGRIAADGSVLAALDEDGVTAAVAKLREQGVEAIAISLVNSYVNPIHEQRAAELARAAAPEIPVVASVDLLREAGEYERSSTAVVNGYLLPVVGSYLHDFAERLRARNCRVSPSIMQSSGGMISLDAAAQTPVRMIESGPAAGVMAATALARACGLRRVISFDMGGTTAKACLIEDFQPSISDEYWVGAGMNREGSRLLRGGGYPIRVPTIDITEVSSGGGSIAWVDAGGALKVGPLSAGADPGPACYGLGGTEPTFTDACVVLGILGRETIGGGLVLHPELAAAAIRTGVAEPLGQTVEEAARGIYRVGISNLTRAVRAVTTDVGKRPEDFAMVAFGGGGGMVAGPVAQELGIEHVVMPPLTGIFSAVGLLAAPFRRDAVQAVFRPLEPATVAATAETATELEERLKAELQAEGHGEGGVRCGRRVDVRYRGQATSVSVEWSEASWSEPERAATSLREEFEHDYARLHGHLREVELEIAAIHVTATAAADAVSFEALGSGTDAGGGADGRRTRRFVDLATGEAAEGTSFSSRAATSGTEPDGDVVIDEDDATVFVPRDFSLEVDQLGALHLRLRGQRGQVVREADPDASSIEIFGNWLGSVNDEMTALIARTAQSEIAKDTLDFATAICDRDGQVVSQGLTMVLHAGSIPTAIELLLDQHGETIQPGDTFLSNDPYRAGGSHLPDLYVIQPLFDGEERIGFVGTVCHVSDMGGRVAGGNAADSHEIYQEGLRLPFVRIKRGGEIVADIERILRTNVRVPEKVLGDLHALIGACAVGEGRVADWVAAHGRRSFSVHAEALLAHAHQLFARRLETFPDGSYSFTDVVDDDGLGSGPIEIRATVERRGERLRIDFAGSDDQVRGAVNAPLAFTRSASYYVAKAVLGPDIPDNSGYFSLIDVEAPAGTVVNPREPAATGAKGATAFRITDALFGAFAAAVPERVPAAGDGGASIIAFAGRESDRPFVLVDLIMSAWGGRYGLDGIDGIASAATNGRNTPVEVIEASYPVRVEAYELVADSGGAGEFRGGLATRRDYRYLGDTEAVLQVRSDRNPTRPWGLRGGAPGDISESVVVAGGEPRSPGSKFTAPIEGETLFEHRTASGAGYGDPHRRPTDAVLDDVLDGKVSREAAAREYGVAIDEDLSVEAMTAELRTQPPLARSTAHSE